MVNTYKQEKRIHILIESKWNLKKNVKMVLRHPPFHINRIKVEFKVV